MQDTLDLKQIRQLSEEETKTRTRRTSLWYVFAAVIIVFVFLLTTSQSRQESVLISIVFLAILMGFHAYIAIGFERLRHISQVKRLKPKLPIMPYGWDVKPLDASYMLKKAIISNRFPLLALILVLISRDPGFSFVVVGISWLLFWGIKYGSIYWGVTPYANRGDYQTALNNLRHIRRWLPMYWGQNSQVMWHEAALHAALNVNDQAKPLYFNLIEHGFQQANLHPVATYLSYLVNWLLSQQKFDECIPLIEVAIRINPNEMSYIFTLVQCYYEQNILPERSLELLDYLKKIDDTQRTQVFVEAYQAIAYAQLGSENATRERLTQIDSLDIELSSYDQVTLYMCCALAEKTLGNIPAAKAYYDKALQRQPQPVIVERIRQILNEMEPEA